ncbi:MAG: hypothetical protein CM15mP75_3470 [Flammeovirgaceae bacterium]|nr:MAG: hypothetical protein CM15mP75_3470 [Flammeovirgaceae bacterium]
MITVVFLSTPGQLDQTVMVLVMATDDDGDGIKNSNDNCPPPTDQLDTMQMEKETCAIRMMMGMGT